MDDDDATLVATSCPGSLTDKRLIKIQKGMHDIDSRFSVIVRGVSLKQLWLLLYFDGERDAVDDAAITRFHELTGD
jgi:hypothetical protein